MIDMKNIKTLSEVISQMKQEILADVKAGIVPKNVTNFGDLHSYVDANCYGGFCEDNGLIDDLIDMHGGRDRINDGMPDAVHSFISEAQNSINDWVISGAILECDDGEI